MKIDYSFLRDELALIEIRKHKWIESEKLGQEIGFATAAHDWINKHGFTWKKFRSIIETPGSIFDERRQYRRFAIQFPLHLQYEDTTFATSTNDINLIGLSCTLPISVPKDSPVAITINLSDPAQDLQKNYQFSTRILRISKPKSTRSLCFRAFLPFTEQIRDYLRSNRDFFKQLIPI